jgi:hypothetical protein
MDGALAKDLYSTVIIWAFALYMLTSREVSRIAKKGFHVNGPGAYASADLGDSSKYSNESFED